MVQNKAQESEIKELRDRVIALEENNVRQKPNGDNFNHKALESEEDLLNVKNDSKNREYYLSLVSYKNVNLQFCIVVCFER